MVSCTPHRVPHSGHSQCCPGPCSSRSSKRFGSPSKRHSPTRHFGSKPSAAVKSSSGVITATKLRICFCAIATQESSKRLFLQKSDSYPLRNLEQRSRSKRNKWRGPPSAAREGRRPFMPDWFLSVAGGCAERVNLAQNSPNITTYYQHRTATGLFSIARVVLVLSKKAGGGR